MAALLLKFELKKKTCFPFRVRQKVLITTSTGTEPARKPPDHSKFCYIYIFMLPNVEFKYDLY